MKGDKFLRCLVFGAWCLVVWSSSAQTLSNNWSVISGGGGDTTGSVFIVRGTIGQALATAPQATDNLSVAGGFWSFLSTVHIFAPRSIVLAEGTSSNLTILAVSDRSPLNSLQFEPANAPPPFASLSSAVLTNTPTNGSASAMLQLAAGYGDTGNYLLTLRATAVNGESGVLQISVTIVPAVGVTVTRWKDPTNGNWSDPTKWTAGLPSSTTPAIIDIAGSYIVTLDTSATVAGLTLGGSGGIQILVNNSQTLTLNGPGSVRSNGVINQFGGDLRGAGNLMINGLFNWSADVLNRLFAGGELIVASGATMNITGGNVKGLNRTLRNRGTVNYTGTALTFNRDEVSNGRIENEASATFIVDGDGDFATGGSGNNSFNNAGLFIKRNAANTFFSNLVPFNNNGTVNIEAGTLEFRTGGTYAGAINAVGGVLSLTGGTHNLNAGSLLNQGALGVSGVTLNVNSASAVNFTNLSASFSTISFPIDYTLAVLVLGNGADLAGSGNITVTNLCNWSTDYLSHLFAGGELMVAGTAAMNITGGNVKGLNRTLRNRGTVNYTGTALTFNRDQVSNGRIENEAGATFIVDGDGDFTTGGSGNNAFNNAGLFIKRNAANTFFDSLVAFNNNGGTVNIEAGTLEFRTGGTYAGAINAVGGVLSLTGGTHNLNVGGLLNQGALGVSGVTLNVNSASAVNFNNLSATFSTISFPIDYTLAVLVLGNGADLMGSGNITVTNLCNWSADALSHLFAGGELVVAGTAAMNITGGNVKGLNRTLRNRGTVNYTGTALTFNRDQVSNGRIENEAGATFIVDGDGDFTTGGSGNNAFNNAGLFIKRNGANTFFDSLVAFNNNGGTVNIEAGTLDFRAGGAHSGQFSSSPSGTLRFVSGTHSLSGASFSGAGTVRFQSPVQLVADVNCGNVNAIFESSASLSGNFRVSNLPGGTITVSKSMTFPGAMDVGGAFTLSSPSFIVTNSGSFTLEAGATLNNPGTNFSVCRFINKGGAINGNPPTTFCPAPTNATLSSPVLLANGSFRFSVNGTPGISYVIQLSTNLSGSNWMSVFTNAVPFTFTDTTASQSMQRFYRAPYLP